MQWYVSDTWIVIIGGLCALSCSLLGNFLVLRRMSMMGDAISHAVLPGLAAGFILTGSRTSVVMFVGAVATGLITALFTQWVHQFGKVDRGAAMGVVFTTLFAIGLILIVRSADHVDLDPSCVLYGLIEMAPYDTMTVGSIRLPRAVLVLSGALALNLIFVLLFFKELKISSFDPTLATTLGINAKAMHYLLMTLVAITTVASFEAIGSILVIAMLIVPPAVARLMTDRLWTMMLISAGVAVVSAGLGHWAAFNVPAWFDLDATRTAGSMATIAGLLFTVTLLLAPRHGLVSKAIHRAALRLRILREDVLGLLYRIEESGDPLHLDRTVPALLASLGIRRTAVKLTLATLRSHRMIEQTGSSLRLTDMGRAKAVDLVRSHRLWEVYLQKHTPLPADHLHAPAERLEHVTDPAMQDRLDRETDQATKDPHGKTVPPLESR